MAKSESDRRSRLPAKTAPLTEPSDFWTSHAFAVLPVRLASVPEPVAVPRPKNALVVVPPAGVHLHVLPVSVAFNVFDAVAPVIVSAAVDGAHASVPRMPVRVVAFVQSVVTVAANVPVPSFSLRAIEPESAADGFARLAPVPLTLARTAA